MKRLRRYACINLGMIIHPISINKSNINNNIIYLNYMFRSFGAISEAQQEKVLPLKLLGIFV
jgi:hypothetical protein